MTGPGWCRPAAAALLLAVVVAACSGSDAGPARVSSSTGASAGPAATPTGPPATTPTSTSTTSTPAPTLRATATRSNLFESNRAFRLELDHDAGPAVETVALRLASDLFEPMAPQRRDMELAPGSHVLVPLPYGPAVCDAPAGADLGAVVVTTTAGDLSVPLVSYPDDLVAGLHERECQVAAAAEAVDLAYGSDWEPASPRAVTGTLVVAPDPDHDVEVVALAGNIVFGLTTEVALPTTLADGQVELPVRMAADRCDRHALIEAKRKEVAIVEVAVDGDEPVALEVIAEGPTLAIFQDLLERCSDLPEEG